MSPDDERHGTRRGYYAHRRAGQDACEPCRRAAARAEQVRQLRVINGIPGLVPAIGTQRRLRALQARGWTLTEVGNRVGTQRSMVEKWCNTNKQHVYATTARRVAAVYEELAMLEPPPGPWTTRTRNLARRRGYAPPLAWVNIDDPNERPDTGYKPVRKRRGTELHDELEHLLSLGVSEHQAAKQLGITVGAIERARERKGAAA